MWLRERTAMHYDVASDATNERDERREEIKATTNANTHTRPQKQQTSPPKTRQRNENYPKLLPHKITLPLAVNGKVVFSTFCQKQHTHTKHSYAYIVVLICRITSILAYVRLQYYKDMSTLAQHDQPQTIL